MFDAEIASFAASNGGRIPSVIPLLDHLSRLHPEMEPGALVAQTDAGIDRLYRAKRLFFAGHQWLLHDPPEAVAGYLMKHLGELRYDATTQTWSWTGTPWTANITVP